MTTTVEPIVLSQSSIKQWHFCEQAYYYKHIVGIVPRGSKLQLIRGSLIHGMIEAHLTGGNWKDVWNEGKRAHNALLEEERDELGDIPGDALKIIRDYLLMYKHDPLKVVMVEQTLGPFEIADGVMLKGTLDRMVEDEHGLLWIMDTKTHKQFPDEKTRSMNMQAPLYMFLAQQAGYNPRGIIWDYIKTKPPTVPEMLQSGKLSKRKNLDSTSFAYAREVRQRGLETKDYADMIAHLKLNNNNFFYRLKQPIPQAMVDRVVYEAYLTGKRIREQAEEPARNLHWLCSRCDYMRLCKNELNNVDNEFILKHDYQANERGI